MSSENASTSKENSETLAEAEQPQDVVNESENDSADKSDSLEGSEHNQQVEDAEQIEKAEQTELVEANPESGQQVNPDEVKEQNQPEEPSPQKPAVAGLNLPLLISVALIVLAIVHWNSN